MKITRERKVKDVINDFGIVSIKELPKDINEL
jgi:hypothetical protein